MLDHRREMKKIYSHITSTILVHTDQQLQEENQQLQEENNSFLLL
jgi:hypothetical protein